jgi:hypothetical protein
MGKRLNKALEKLDYDYAATIILSKKDYNKRVMEILKILVNKNKFRGAYIALNKPYKELIKNMKKNGINYKNVLFIDCVTKKQKSIPNCVFLRSAESLTHMGICLEPIYKIDGPEFIFLDSLNALSVYHGNKEVVKFARSLIEKVREHDMVGIFVGLHGETDDKVIDELATVSDDIIDLTWQKGKKLEWQK